MAPSSCSVFHVYTLSLYELHAFSCYMRLQCARVDSRLHACLCFYFLEPRKILPVASPPLLRCLIYPPQACLDSVIDAVYGRGPADPTGCARVWAVRGSSSPVERFAWCEVGIFLPYMLYMSSIAASECSRRRILGSFPYSCPWVLGVLPFLPRGKTKSNLL